VSAATQIYYASFDAVFLYLPPAVRAQLIASNQASWPAYDA
jgi:hypothetical protein